jgi:hypothetical protein
MPEPHQATTESRTVEGEASREYLELWFSLARRNWSSMVLVPADPGGSAADVAHALANAGRRLSDQPVTAVTPRSLEYGTALALAELPQFVERNPAASARWPSGPPGESAEPGAGRGPPNGAPASEPGQQALVVSSAARLIISIPPVLTEPLGLATTQRADLIVVCVEMGRARLANVRRTLDLIGREHVAGCFLVG